MRKLLIPILVILIGLFFSSAYVVQEGTRGIVLRFNKIIALSNPGLHFKIPGMDRVKIVNAKIQTTDSSNNQGSTDQRFFTNQQKELIVDYYVQWKITNFDLYYKAIEGGYSIENLLLARLNGRLRAEIGKLDIKDIINESADNVNSRNSLMIEVKNALNGNINDKSDTTTANDDIDEKATMAAFGVEVVDVRIKQINFPEEVSESIYKRMRTEREIIAREQRYGGVKDADEIRAKVDLRVAEILAEAEKQARTIRGEGDASVAKLYADAFNKDQEFFSFMRSLKAYERSFSGHDVMVISPDSEFFRYMKLDRNK
ncbi:protease modulator HflC [Utexia brackfieldae]|uniref:protease modulator HflC n=1 Tax=Utexia brackfieldae TaxID=3074108 RepID=UPI00370D71ED